MSWFFLTIAAVTFIVFETIFEKKILIKARTLEFATMYALGNAFISVPFLFIADLSKFDVLIFGVIFLAALPSTFSTLLVFKSMKHNQLSEAAPIFALSPLVVTLLAFVFLDEKISLTKLFGIFLMVAGIIFLEFKNLRSYTGIFSKDRGKYLGYISLSLLLGGISATFDRLILYRYQINALTYLVFIQFSIAFIYMIFFYSNFDAIKNLGKSISQYWKIVMVFSLLAVTHRYLYANAIQLASSMGLVVAVYRLSALFNVIIGGKFFAEDGIFRKSLACVIVLLELFF